MGCCTSEERKREYIEITSEEKQISYSEELLVFSRSKLKSLLCSIEAINFPLTKENISNLCYIFHSPTSGASATFFRRLESNNLLTIDNLNSLSILLSLSKNLSKQNMLYADSKEKFISNISKIVDIAVDILPMHLEGQNESISKYSLKVKAVSEEFKRELRELNIREIGEKLQRMIINSSEIRTKFYQEYLRCKSLYKKRISNMTDSLGMTSSTLRLVDIDSDKKERVLMIDSLFEIQPTFNNDESEISGGGGGGEKISDSPLYSSSPVIQDISSLNGFNEFELKNSIDNTLKAVEVSNDSINVKLSNDLDSDKNQNLNRYNSTNIFKARRMFDNSIALFSKKMLEANKKNIEKNKNPEIRSRIPRKTVIVRRDSDIFEKLKGSPSSIYDSSEKKQDICDRKSSIVLSTENSEKKSKIFRYDSSKSFTKKRATF